MRLFTPDLLLAEPLPNGERHEQSEYYESYCYKPCVQRIVEQLMSKIKGQPINDCPRLVLER
ncbi:MAG: hypothetical protein IJV78_02190 [Clostridia bacterium]|nr:hypothetical protein [Clostridia bacterium]